MAHLTDTTKQQSIKHKQHCCGAFDLDVQSKGGLQNCSVLCQASHAYPHIKNHGKRKHTHTQTHPHKHMLRNVPQSAATNGTKPRHGNTDLYMYIYTCTPTSETRTSQKHKPQASSILRSHGGRCFMPFICLPLPSRIHQDYVRILFFIDGLVPGAD